KVGLFAVAGGGHKLRRRGQGEGSFGGQVEHGALASRLAVASGRTRRYQRGASGRSAATSRKGLWRRNVQKTLGVREKKKPRPPLLPRRSLSFGRVATGVRRSLHRSNA